MDSDTPPAPGPADAATGRPRDGHITDGDITDGDITDGDITDGEVQVEEVTVEEVLYRSAPVTVVAVREAAGEVVRVVLVGDVDVHQTHVVREAAAAAVRPQRPLVVDCRDLDFMDSSALALFALLIRSRQPVTVEALAPHLQTLLSVTGLDQLVATRPGRPV